VTHTVAERNTLCKNQTHPSQSTFLLISVGALIAPLDIGYIQPVKEWAKASKHQSIKARQIIKTNKSTKAILGRR